MASVKNIAFEPGNIIVTFDSGTPRRYPASSFINAASVPDLNITSLTLLTQLAQVVLIIVNTLIHAGILDEKLVDGFDMQYVKETLLDNLSAEEDKGE